VLIVEDTQTLLQLYSHTLYQSGYTVREAATIQQATTLLASFKPHVVLLDRVLPDGDGEELCQSIKADPTFGDTFVIMLSALKTSEEDRISGLDAGADDYLVKPVGKRELLARLRVAMRLKNAQLALQQSEAKHRTLAENSPDLIMRLNPAGELIYTNSRYAELFGDAAFDRNVNHHGILGLSDEQAGRWDAACRTVVEQACDQRCELSVAIRGTIHEFDVRFVPEFDYHHSLASILVVLRDDSQRIRSERAVARLAAVIEQNQDSVFITSPTGELLFINAACTTLLGISNAQLGASFRDVYGAANNVAQSLAQHHTTVCMTRQNWSGISKILHHDGTYREIEVAMFVIDDSLANHPIAAAPVQFATGRPAAPAPGTQSAAVVTILRDVTQRQSAEREREIILAMASSLRKATTRDEVIDNMLSQIMNMLEVDSVAITTVDTARGDAFLERVVGVQDHITGNHRANPLRLTHELLDQAQPVLYTDLARPQAGTDGAEMDATEEIYQGRLHNLLGVPLKLSNRNIGVLWIANRDALDDHVVSVLLAVADMAANTLHRVALFEELGQYAVSLEVRVDERTRALAEANQQLRELDRLKSKFVSNVSHELRNPISNLKLYMSLLHRGKPEKRPHYEAMLDSSVQRLGQLVEDILNLSRLEIAHYQPKELEPTDLNAVINQIVTLHNPQAESTGITLHFEADTNVPLLDGDFNQLSQLVTNLIVNSLHYTRRGNVHIRTLAPNGREVILLTVEDTGIGILPEDLPHVFERFYRGNHRQANDIPGTGLGLAIVKEIVDIHHGEIAVESRIDEGTRFEVKLPVRQHAKAQSI
jgi:signal transduction histidine kinase/CheY-like chemotaxis protein